MGRRLPRDSAGILVVGTNPVSTDAVGMSLMGFDPMADRGVAPFEHCDSFLRLAESLGVGTRDLSRIEVAGVKIKDAVCQFRADRKAQRRSLKAGHDRADRKRNEDSSVAGQRVNRFK